MTLRAAAPQRAALIGALLMSVGVSASGALAACSRKPHEAVADSAIARDLAEVQQRGMQSPQTLADSQAASVGMPSLSDSNTVIVAISPTATGRPLQAGTHTAVTTARAPALPATMPVTAATPAVRIPSRGSVAAGPPRSGAGDTSTAGPCGSPSAASQRACITAHLAVSDVRLNSVYGSLIAALRQNAGASAGREPRMVRGLRSAQRAWIVVRDRECQRRTRGVGGQLWAPARARCLADESNKRADELQRMLRSTPRR
ncbi:MAG: lysozyme inhibitor LprI family protein [Gemmatimonadaceae bacterium]